MSAEALLRAALARTYADWDRLHGEAHPTTGPAGSWPSASPGRPGAISGRAAVCWTG
ncbi:hypothetical protein SMICM304S_00091 [Streptomyces microflavus]